MFVLDCTQNLILTQILQYTGKKYSLQKCIVEVNITADTI